MLFFGICIISLFFYDISVTSASFPFLAGYFGFGSFIQNYFQPPQENLLTYLLIYLLAKISSGYHVRTFLNNHHLECLEYNHCLPLVLYNFSLPTHTLWNFSFIPLVLHWMWSSFLKVNTKCLKFLFILNWIA